MIAKSLLKGWQSVFKELTPDDVIERCLSDIILMFKFFRFIA